MMDLERIWVVRRMDQPQDPQAPRSSGGYWMEMHRNRGDCNPNSGSSAGGAVHRFGFSPGIAYHLSPTIITRSVHDPARAYRQVLLLLYFSCWLVFEWLPLLEKRFLGTPPRPAGKPRKNPIITLKRVSNAAPSCGRRFRTLAHQAPSFSKHLSEALDVGPSDALDAHHQPLVLSDTGSAPGESICAPFSAQVGDQPGPGPSK